ncbi:hypothetical protein BJX61DRAFT_488295 [Aspergillus egyptiacus]|nr:hypothetical protein BJX61DRAFT_488295 [Aspergillus egyptiacus]
MLAQGKSAGLITRRSLDRNQDMLCYSFTFLPLFLCAGSTKRGPMFLQACEAFGENSLCVELSLGSNHYYTL